MVAILCAAPAPQQPATRTMLLPPLPHMAQQQLPTAALVQCATARVDSACSRSTVLRVPLAIAVSAAAWAQGVPRSAAAAADAAGVVQLAGASGLAAFLPSLPPEPIALPRRRLGPSFAVLLLRSGYEAVDALDFLPMDDFQRDFWLLRRAEWEPYTLQYSPLLIKQGDLSDPQYFDFISCMQLATVSTAIPAGRRLFKEYCEEDECPGGTRLVTRDPELQDNALLPAAFQRKTGELIYDGVRQGFQGVQFGAPAPLRAGATFGEVVAGVAALLAVFEAQGFAIRAGVSGAQPGGGGGGQFTVQLEGPATLWSLQSLASRRSSVYPAYDALAISAFLRASGREARCELQWTDTVVTERWSVV